MKSSLAKRRGDYGKRKFKVFAVLNDVGVRRGRDGYLSTKELAIYSGIPYRSLTRCLPDWVKWEYVERRPVSDKYKHLGDFEYRLLAHGSAWLKIAREKLHSRKQFSQDLNKWYRFGCDNFTILASMKFNDLIAVLSKISQGVPADRVHTAKVTYNEYLHRYDVEFDE